MSDTDLVERLRALRPSQRGEVVVHEMVLRMAADEIDRLRSCKPLPEGDALIDELKQEILRLLQHIDHLEFIIKDMERRRT